VPCHSSLSYGEWEIVLFCCWPVMQVKVALSSYLHSSVRICGWCIVSELSLAVWLRNCLIYLLVEALASLPPKGSVVWCCKLFLSSFWFAIFLRCPVTLLCFPLLSSLWLLCMYSLISIQTLIDRAWGESFYSSTILPALKLKTFLYFIVNYT
jgi:hypothetical protein